MLNLEQNIRSTSRPARPSGRLSYVCFVVLGWILDLFPGNRELNRANRKLDASRDEVMRKARENTQNLTGRPRI